MARVQEAFYRLAPHIVDFAVDETGTAEYAETRPTCFQVNMFADLSEAIEEVTGSEHGESIAVLGAQTGYDIAARMDREFRDIGLLDVARLVIQSGFDLDSIHAISSTDNLSQAQKIYGYGRYAGWLGPLKVVDYEDGHHIKARLTNCFEAQSFSDTGTHGCHFLPGVHRGVMAYLWDLPPDQLTQEETACIAAGDDYCTHVIRHEA